MDESTIILKAKIELARQLYQESRGRIKIIKHDLEVATKDRREFGMYDDCGEFYQDGYKEAKITLQCAVAEHIRLEKTMRFYKHRLRELTTGVSNEG